MKFLGAFVLALVLVAQGKVVPSDDGERVHVVDVQPEETGGYAAEVEAVQEAGDVIPQRVFNLGAGDPAVRVFSPEVEQRVDSPQESQRAYETEDRAFDQFQMPDSLYIPIISRSCTNSACLYICNLLGFQKGVCISTSTCQCTN